MEELEAIVRPKRLEGDEIFITYMFAAVEEVVLMVMSNQSPAKTGMLVIV